MNRKKITLLRYRSRYFIFKTDVIEFKPLDWKRGEILQLNLTNLARFGKMPGPQNYADSKNLVWRFVIIVDW